MTAHGMDGADARRGGLLITILASAYTVSRGTAEAGTRDSETAGSR